MKVYWDSKFYVRQKGNVVLILNLKRKREETKTFRYIAEAQAYYRNFVESLKSEQEDQE